MQIPEILQDVWAYYYAQVRYFAIYIMEMGLPIEEDETIPTACCREHSLAVNPGYFQGLPTVRERGSGVGHEVLHHQLNHPRIYREWKDAGKVGDLPFVDWVAQFAFDYIVNDTLVVFGMTLNKTWLHDRTKGTWMDLEEEVYRRIYEEEEKSGGGVPQQCPYPTGPGAGQPDVQAAEGPASPLAERIKGEVMKRLLEKLDPSSLRGVGAADFDRFCARLNPPHVKWRDHIAANLRGNLGTGSRTWMRPDRRRLALGYTLPGKIGLTTKCAVVEMDTSGSIGKIELNNWLGHASEIIRQCRPRTTYLLEVDDAVHRARKVRSPMDWMVEATKIEREGMKGGGGTDMTHVFRWCAQEKVVPDTVVILTDGYTGFGTEQPYPVLWCITTPGIVAPHGKTIHVPIRDLK